MKLILDTHIIVSEYPHKSNPVLPEVYSFRCTCASRVVYNVLKHNETYITQYICTIKVRTLIYLDG